MGRPVFLTIKEAAEAVGWDQGNLSRHLKAPRSLARKMIADVYIKVFDENNEEIFVPVKGATVNYVDLETLKKSLGSKKVKP